MQIFGFFCGLLAISAVAHSSAKPFRLHIFNEPSSLRPWDQKNSNAGYFLSQITSSLMSYQDGKLSGNLAESCIYKDSKTILCQIRKDSLWSNGKPIAAEDFVRAFQTFLSPQNHAFRGDLLFPVKNAKAIYQGKEKSFNLGIKAQAPQKLQIDLEIPDHEFIYTLASPLLFPIPPDGIGDLEKIRTQPNLWVSSGPYQIQAWDYQKKITLTSNSNYWKKNSQRPQIEFLFIPEDSVAVGLYEKKQLDLLRRLPTLYIPKYKGRPDYFEVPQIRFDYLGLNIPDEKIRKALSASLNYSDLQKLFSAHAPPGCPGIGKKYYNGDLCVTYNPNKAKADFSEKKTSTVKIEFLYSKQGGDDHQRGMEWMQSEWKKNLGLSVDLRGLENKIYIQTLETKTPDIFRKGIAPERPTCLAALENFQSNSSENYLHFKSSEFDQIIKTMMKTASEAEKKKLCTQGLKLLLDPAWIIPTGPIHFTLLVRPEWTGWKLNELNQLDLSDLKAAH